MEDVLSTESGWKTSVEDVGIPMRNAEGVADQWKKYISLNLSLSQQHLPRFTQGFSHLPRRLPQRLPTKLWWEHVFRNVFQPNLGESAIPQRTSALATPL